MTALLLPAGLHAALALFFQLAWLVILAHVIMSWLISFQVLNLHQPLVYKIWDLLNRVLEPVYGPIRRILPAMPGIDITPMIVIIGMIFLQRLLGL